MTSQGRYAAAASTPTSKVVASKNSTASSGTPISAMALPSWLTVSPIQNKRKLRCRKSPPNRRLPPPGAASYTVNGLASHPPTVMPRRLPRTQRHEAAIC